MLLVYLLNALLGGRWMGSSRCHLDAAFFSSAREDADLRWLSWSCGRLCKALHGHTVSPYISSLMITMQFLGMLSENNVFPKVHNCSPCCRWAKRAAECFIGLGWASQQAKCRSVNWLLTYNSCPSAQSPIHQAMAEAKNGQEQTREEEATWKRTMRHVKAKSSSVSRGLVTTKWKTTNKLPLMHSLSGPWHGCISVMCLPAQNSREVFSVRMLGVGESRWIYLAPLGEQTGSIFYCQGRN